MNPEWNSTAWKMPDAFAWQTLLAIPGSSKVKDDWLKGTTTTSKYAKLLVSDEWMKFVAGIDPLISLPSTVPVPTLLANATPGVLDEICWMRKNVICFGAFVPGMKDWYISSTPKVAGGHEWQVGVALPRPSAFH